MSLTKKLSCILVHDWDELVHFYTFVFESSWTVQSENYAIVVTEKGCCSGNIISPFLSYSYVRQSFESFCIWANDNLTLVAWRYLCQKLPWKRSVKLTPTPNGNRALISFAFELSWTVESENTVVAGERTPKHTSTKTTRSTQIGLWFFLHLKPVGAQNLKFVWCLLWKDENVAYTNCWTLLCPVAQCFSQVPEFDFFCLCIKRKDGEWVTFFSLWKIASTELKKVSSLEARWVQRPSVALFELKKKKKSKVRAKEVLTHGQCRKNTMSDFWRNSRLPEVQNKYAHGPRGESFGSPVRVALPGCLCTKCEATNEYKWELPKLFWPVKSTTNQPTQPIWTNYGFGFCNELGCWQKRLFLPVTQQFLQKGPWPWKANLISKIQNVKIIVSSLFCVIQNKPQKLQTSAKRCWLWISPQHGY